MLPIIYAHALHKSSKGKEGQDISMLIANLKTLLVRKGHARLLPAIVREYEKLVERTTGNDQGVLEVATKEDVKHLSVQIEEAASELKLSSDSLQVRENNKLIGGFLLRKKAMQVDASYRRKLIELYRQLVAA